MIRLIQRRLIVPRGDTGTFSIPVLAGKDIGDTSIFTIFDPLTHTKIFEKVMQLSNEVLSMNLTHGDTVNLPVGQFVWDIKFYTNPVFVDEKLVSGEEVDSYYAAFNLPECEIRETGDNLLMADDAPTSTLRPDQINLIEAAIVEVHNAQEDVEASKISAASSAESAGASEVNAQQYAADALADKNAAVSAKNDAESAASDAAASALEASNKAAEIQANLETKANVADLSQVAFSGEYNDLAHKPYIPVNTSDLTNDSNFAVDANYVHTDNNYTTAEKNKLSSIAAGAEVNVNADWNANSGDAQILNKPTNVSAFNNDAGYLTEHQDISGKANSADLATVATSGSYNDLSNKPTNVSAFNNDAGYLTSFTETDPTVPSWAKAENKPTYTASEVGAPTVAEMNSAIGTAIANVHQFELSIQQSLPTQDIDTHTIYLIPKTGDTNDVYDEYVYIDNAWEMIGNTQIDLSNYVQKNQIATNSIAGLVKINGSGLSIVNDIIRITPASDAQIKTAANTSSPITPVKQHQSVFYGLAAAAGDTTQSQSNNTVGTYTSEAKTAIRTMLDVPSTSDIPTVPVQDVQVNGTSVLSNGVANIPPATTSYGVVKIQDYSTHGLAFNNDGFLQISPSLQAQVKAGINERRPIAPFIQHESVFYGLSKVAGVDLANEEVTVGTYPTTSQTAIRSMIGAVGDVQVTGTSVVQNGVADIPLATYNNAGVVKVSPTYGIGFRPSPNNDTLIIAQATEAVVKTGTNNYQPIVPSRQHAAAFYGLAKAAGDTTQSSSANAVGTYTNEAKAAIQAMLGVASTSDLPIFATDEETQAIITEWEASV